jgi:hypothetical protein
MHAYLNHFERALSQMVSCGLHGSALIWLFVTQTVSLRFALNATHARKLTVCVTKQGTHLPVALTALAVLCYKIRSRIAC